MRLTIRYTIGQVFLFAALPFLCACSVKKEESPIIPPVTSPLSGDYIGFGVVTVSYTHVTVEPAEDSDSLGYLRRGSVVRVLRRQTVKNASDRTSWVLTEGNQQGWLKEEVIDIYDSESRAKTAAKSMGQ
jgi:hypothetical protein